SLQPRFIFGQEVFYYGLATAFCRRTTRVLMPWGGDVFMYAEASAIAFAMVRYSLQHVDLVCPSSVTAASHICSRFGVPSERIAPISWGVDRRIFRRVSVDERKEICVSFGLDPCSTIIMNVRRFRPAWGSDAAIAAFLR